MSEPIKIGLLAASRIATKAVIEPAALIDDVEVAAVAARSADRASEAALRWGLDRSFGSYRELLDSDVDAVYIGAPAALHRRWAIATLEAGKHLLCEKPLASNAADGQAIADAANAASSRGLVAMEAFHWRYHPYAEQIRDVLDSGELGDVQRVTTRFDIQDGLIGPDDIRWNLAIGGWALMDLGCYNVQWLRFVGHVLGLGEPTVASAQAECPVEGVDGQMEAELRWASGVTGYLHTSMMAQNNGVEGNIGGTVANLVVHGTRGTMTALNPLSPHNGASLIVDVDGRHRSEDVASSTTYYHQMRAFLAAIHDGTEFPSTIADGVLNMTVIDACYRAAGLDPRPVVED
jgi:predicted dehydrogenase